MYDDYAKIRDRKGLTDYEVAKLGDFSRSVLTSWKNGTSTPSVKVAHKISNVLNVPIWDFLNERTPKDEAADISVDSLIDQQKKLQHEISNIKYTLKLADNSEIELTFEEAEELNRAVEAYIQVYCENLLKLHEKKKDDQ